MKIGNMQYTRELSANEASLNYPAKVVLVSLLVLGTFLLIYKFPSVPAGLHQDEISEAYESYSLLHTGADRWGHHYPVYFFSWGSGQNVLQAYLTMPVVALAGLTRLSARFIPLVGGLLTLPLLYFTVRLWYGVPTALVSLLFLALSPWHIMISRWGLESSLVPFFLLLGIYTFSKGLHSASSWWIIPSFVPFALALYTYGVTVVVVPFLIFLLLFVGWPSIHTRLRAWISALAVFSGLSLPIFFFCVKNYISRYRHDFAFERWLPVTVPVLPVTRLDQIKATSSGAHHSAFALNARFVLHGLSDRLPWSEAPGVRAIPAIVLALAVVAIVHLLVGVVQERKLRDPFLVWLLACVPMMLVMPIEVSRGIALFLPFSVLGALGAMKLLDMLHRKVDKVAFLAIGAVLFLVPIIRFIRTYYGPIYESAIAWDFNAGLPLALDQAQQLGGPTQPLYVSEHILLNYMYTLFYTQTNPADFQRSGADYLHPDFGRYRFSHASLERTSTPYTFLLKGTEPPVCINPVATKQIGQFLIGECR